MACLRVIEVASLLRSGVHRHAEAEARVEGLFFIGGTEGKNQPGKGGTTGPCRSPERDGSFTQQTGKVNEVEREQEGLAPLAEGSPRRRVSSFADYSPGS